VSSRPNDRRRALAGQRGGGRTGGGGDPRWLGALEDALRAPQRAGDDDGPIGKLHALHPYPARMHPATAAILIGATVGEEGGARVLDPFCGAGTTLIEARRLGHAAIGVDLNPQAVAIARAKTWVVPKDRRKELRRIGKDLAADAMSAGRAARRAGAPATPRHRPGKDAAARARTLAPWFLPHVRAELEDLAARIDEVAATEPEVAAILRIPLSAILYKVSLRASETDASRVDKRLARGAATRLFDGRIEQLWDGLNALAHRAGPPVEVLEGDARRLDGVADGSIDAIVTSSPYAGTYDYAAQQGLRLAFFGVDAGVARAGEIGARGAMAAADALDDFAADLAATFAAWVRVLRPGGLAVLMIGDSLAGRRAVLAEELVNRVLPDALEPVAWAWQERAKLGAAEARAFGDEAKREHLLLARRR
jgi:SAM-dependent methyltransferase